MQGPSTCLNAEEQRGRQQHGLAGTSTHPACCPVPCVPPPHHHHQVQPGLEAVQEKARQLERSQLQPKELRIRADMDEDLTQLLREPGATASWLANVEEVCISPFTSFKFTGGLAGQVCAVCTFVFLLHLYQHCGPPSVPVCASGHSCIGHLVVACGTVAMAIHASVNYCHARVCLCASRPGWVPA